MADNRSVIAWTLVPPFTPASCGVFVVALGVAELDGDDTVLWLQKKKMPRLVSALKLAVDVTVYFENTSSLFVGHVIYNSSKRDPITKYEIAYLHTHASQELTKRNE